MPIVFGDPIASLSSSSGGRGCGQATQQHPVADEFQDALRELPGAEQQHTVERGHGLDEQLFAALRVQLCPRKQLCGDETRATKH